MGLTHAVLAILSRMALPSPHLTLINPHVATALDQSRSHVGGDGRCWVLPRQGGCHAVGHPRPRGRDRGAYDEASAARAAVTGVSAFAFQGTNAHVLLAAASGHAEPSWQQIHAPRDTNLYCTSTAPVWVRQRFYPGPPPSIFVTGVKVIPAPLDGGRRTGRPTAAIFDCFLGHPSLSFVMQHLVGGARLSPVSFLLSVAMAAAASAFSPLGGERALHREELSLQNVSFSSPCDLAALMAGGAGGLRTSLDLNSGLVTISVPSAATSRSDQASTEGGHRPCMFAKAVALLTSNHHPETTTSLEAGLHRPSNAEASDPATSRHHAADLLQQPEGIDSVDLRLGAGSLNSGLHTGKGLMDLRHRMRSRGLLVSLVASQSCQLLGDVQLPQAVFAGLGQADCDSGAADWADVAGGPGVGGELLPHPCLMEGAMQANSLTPLLLRQCGGRGVVREAESPAPSVGVMRAVSRIGAVFQVTGAAPHHLATDGGASDWVAESRSVGGSPAAAVAMAGGVSADGEGFRLHRGTAVLSACHIEYAEMHVHPSTPEESILASSLGACQYPNATQPHAGSGSGVASGRSSATSPPTGFASFAEVLALVEGLVAAALGGDAPPGREEPLMAAGLDSLGAVELRNGLQVGGCIRVGGDGVLSRHSGVAGT